jgi:hypothetical protein
VQGSTRYNLFAEAAGRRRLKAEEGARRSEVQWSGGVEFELMPEYWLSTGFGKRYAGRGRPDHVALIANVRWGISSKSRLDLTPPRK